MKPGMFLNSGCHQAGISYDHLRQRLQVL